MKKQPLLPPWRVTASSAAAAVSASRHAQLPAACDRHALLRAPCTSETFLAYAFGAIQLLSCHQVCVLRNYLGTALIHAYELRHLTLKKLLVAQSAAGGSSGMLDLDADLYLTTYSRSVMLEWVDALWSCFLEVCVCDTRGEQGLLWLACYCRAQA